MGAHHARAVLVAAHLGLALVHALVRVAHARALVRQRVARREGRADGEQAGRRALLALRAERPPLRRGGSPRRRRRALSRRVRPARPPLFTWRSVRSAGAGFRRPTRLMVRVRPDDVKVLPHGLAEVQERLHLRAARCVEEPPGPRGVGVRREGARPVPPARVALLGDVVERARVERRLVADDAEVRLLDAPGVGGARRGVRRRGPERKSGTGGEEEAWQARWTWRGGRRRGDAHWKRAGSPPLSGWWVRSSERYDRRTSACTGADT